MSYTPSKKILDKYADLMINYALGSGKGVKKGDVVLMRVPEPAKPMLKSLYEAAIKKGAHVIAQFSPEGMGRTMYELGSDEQLTWTPKKYAKGLMAQVDHFISVISTTNKHELKGINPKKIMLRQKSGKFSRKLFDDKVNKNKLTWTICLYGTKEMAKEVGLTEKQYWNQIIKACYLDEKNPVAKWKAISKRLHSLKAKLNKLDVKAFHIKAKNTDLTIGIGKNRNWLGATGQNIPSFELYISPDNRVADGRIEFTQPLYRYGQLIDGISLEFRNGKVVKAKAKKGEKVLKEMIAVKGADRIGEFSLTEGAMSRITKFMGETLYDENVGGRYGNTHIALGSAYKDSYPGNVARVPKKKWKQMGYNESVVHTDIVSTHNRTVTALLANGKEKVIYKNGKFVI